jgi:hypothetical protein
MAFELHTNPLPGIAATVIADQSAVRFIPGATQRAVGPVASTNQEPVGVVDAGATSLAPVTVYGEHSYVKALAVASVGAGANVGHASANGALGPVVAASGAAVWRIGVSQEPAAAGQVFTVLVNPRQLSGLV